MKSHVRRILLVLGVICICYTILNVLTKYHPLEIKPNNDISLHLINDLQWIQHPLGDLINGHGVAIESFITNGPFVYSLEGNSSGDIVPSIYVSTNNRLGNVLNQYATWYSFVKSSGHSGKFFTNYKLSHIFPNLAPQMDLTWNTNVSPVSGIMIKERHSGVYDTILVNRVLHSNRFNSFVCCYFESYKYWDQYSDDIRWLFTFSDSLQKKAQNVLHQARREIHGSVETYDVTYVGIHVRRGDYVRFPRIMNMAPVTYFEAAKDLFNERFNNVIFIVASNGLDWCQENLKDEQTYFVEGHDLGDDLATLSACNHTIASQGTFSWWAGWLADGLTIYFEDLYNNEEWVRNNPHADRFPKDWIPMK